MSDYCDLNKANYVHCVLVAEGVSARSVRRDEKSRFVSPLQARQMNMVYGARTGGVVKQSG